jgi:N6-adenosine-specific RNA methylase IME4
MILPSDPGAWPVGVYDVVYADPPWPYRDKSLQRGGAARHYTTMGLEEICGLPVGRLCRPGAVVCLWVTWPMRPSTAERVMAAWGFEYSTCLYDWFKTNADGTLYMGMGHASRANSEPCFLGRRVRLKGEERRVLKVVDHGVRMAQLAPKGAHSAKPEQFRRGIERLYGDVPRVELFAREVHAGWDAWGDHLIDNGQGTMDSHEQQVEQENA